MCEDVCVWVGKDVGVCGRVRMCMRVGVKDVGVYVDLVNVYLKSKT